VDKEKFKHTLQVIDDIPKFPYRMTIEYKDIGWNELCAQTIEQFGLPGGRFTVSVNVPGTLTFLFKSEQDFLFFKLKWSEYEF
jgi:hypothetical protein